MLPEKMIANVNSAISDLRMDPPKVSLENRIRLCQECVDGLAAAAVE